MKNKYRIDFTEKGLKRESRITNTIEVGAESKRMPEPEPADRK